jgi:hypothetical protein
LPGDVAEVPQPDSCTTVNPCLLDHLVGAGEKEWRECKADRSRRPNIDDQFEFGGLLDRNLCWKADVRGRVRYENLRAPTRFTCAIAPLLLASP